MKRYLLFVVFLLGNFSSSMAISPSDSLSLLLSKAKTAQQKLPLLLQLCDNYKNYPIDSFRRFIHQAQTIAYDLKDVTAQAEANYYLGVYYYRTNKMDSLSIAIFLKRDLVFPKKNLNLALANQIALLEASSFVKQDKLKEALAIYFDVLARATIQQDSIAYLTALNGVGWVNLELGKFDEAINWLMKGLQTPSSKKYERYKLNYYVNIAACYGALNKISEAKKVILEGLELAEQHYDLYIKANGLNILGNIYIEENNLPKAIECLTKATEIRNKIGDPFYIVADMSQLSLLYFSNKEFDKAIALSKKAVEIALEEDIEAKLPFLYFNLSEMQYKMGKYKDAYLTLNELNRYKDKRYQAVPAEKLKELEVKYQSSINENIIQKQKFQLTLKNYLLAGVVLLLLLVATMGIMAVRNAKNKASLKLKASLAQQREENTKAIIAIEEKERTRFAAELHDGLGPMLSAVKHNLSSFNHSLESLPSNELETFNKAMNLLDESCKEVRSVSHSIMPNALLKNGLAHAVKDFISKVSNSNIFIDLHIHLFSKRLDSAIEVAVYRIIQECVNNVIKHAEATQLDISINQEPSELSVTIEDNGKGFEQSIMNNQGIGLNNIKARVKYLNGQLEVDTRPGNGTLIAFHIPLTTSPNVA